jgi:hypothetical protein
MTAALASFAAVRKARVVPKVVVPKVVVPKVVVPKVDSSLVDLKARLVVDRMDRANFAAAVPTVPVLVVVVLEIVDPAGAASVTGVPIVRRASTVPIVSSGPTALLRAALSAGRRVAVASVGRATVHRPAVHSAIASVGPMMVLPAVTFAVRTARPKVGLTDLAATVPTAGLRRTNRQRLA